MKGWQQPGACPLLRQMGAPVLLLAFERPVLHLWVGEGRQWLLLYQLSPSRKCPT